MSPEIKMSVSEADVKQIEEIKDTILKYVVGVVNQNMHRVTDIFVYYTGT